MYASPKLSYDITFFNFYKFPFDFESNIILMVFYETKIDVISVNSIIYVMSYSDAN